MKYSDNGAKLFFADVATSAVCNCIKAENRATSLSIPDRYCGNRMIAKPILEIPRRDRQE